MSSLAAARADNFYFPPDWRPEYGGISKFAGSKGANQYQQYGIIRFEIPFDAWCLGCERHVGKGTRFNAKKDKDGKYFSTTIFSFSMKCASCETKFVIKTNPEKMTYDFVEGLRKMEQDFIPDDGDGIIEATNDGVREQLATNPMFRLQHEKEDQVKAMTMNERLSALEDVQDTNWGKDYDMNAALRARNRNRKHRDSELLEEGRSRGLSIPLVESSSSDVAGAKAANIVKHRGFKSSERKKFVGIQGESIFHSNAQGSKKRKRDPHTSSEAGKSTRLHVAVLKQAERRIDVGKLRLPDAAQPSQSAILSIDAVSVIRRSTKGRSTKSVIDATSIKGVKSSIVSLNSAPTTVSSTNSAGLHALGLLGAYADSDSD